MKQKSAVLFGGQADQPAIVEYIHDSSFGNDSVSR